MKIAIIYSTSSGITKKAAKILSNKIKAKIQLIPIEKAKTACLLKYDFMRNADKRKKTQNHHLFLQILVMK